MAKTKCCNPKRRCLKKLKNKCKKWSKKPDCKKPVCKKKPKYDTTGYGPSNREYGPSNYNYNTMPRGTPGGRGLLARLKSKFYKRGGD